MKNVYLNVFSSVFLTLLGFYLNQVKKYGGVPIKLIAYMEYLMISVMVQAKRSKENPIEDWEEGQR